MRLVICCLLFSGLPLLAGAAGHCALTANKDGSGTLQAEVVDLGSLHAGAPRILPVAIPLHRDARGRVLPDEGPLLRAMVSGLDLQQMLNLGATPDTPPAGNGNPLDTLQLPMGEEVDMLMGALRLGAPAAAIGRNAQSLRGCAQHALGENALLPGWLDMATQMSQLNAGSGMGAVTAPQPNTLRGQLERLKALGRAGNGVNAQMQGVLHWLIEKFHWLIAWLQAHGISTALKH